MSDSPRYIYGKYWDNAEILHVYAGNLPGDEFLFHFDMDRNTPAAEAFTMGFNEAMRQQRNMIERMFQMY